MTPEEQQAFLREHRLVIVGFARKAGPPHMSPVYYAMDGEDIVISTTASRLKAKAVRRSPQISLCVIGEQPPFPYLLVYGTGVIEEKGAVDVMMMVGEKMTGNPIPEAARPAIKKRAKDEGRVVLRVRPTGFASTTPYPVRKA